MMNSHHSPFGPHPERIPSHHLHAFADHSRQFTFFSLGNVNDREWSANVRKYLYRYFGPHPERIPSHHPHAFADHSRQFTFSSLGNVNDREWAVNVRKYLYGGDGALGEQASCLLCLLIHRCQTDIKQISVLHLSNICGQTGCLLCLLIHRCQTDICLTSV